MICVLLLTALPQWMHILSGRLIRAVVAYHCVLTPCRPPLVSRLVVLQRIFLYVSGFLAIMVRYADSLDEEFTVHSLDYVTLLVPFVRHHLPTKF